jgi:translation initiation factor IF-2
VQIVHAAVGGITESDVNLATASKAVIIGFNARADAQARKLAEPTASTSVTTASFTTRSTRSRRHCRACWHRRSARPSLVKAEIRQVILVSKVGAIAG